MARVLSIEDKDPNVRSVITSRTKIYSDIDLTFTKRPSGDIYKKSDSAAVKQSVKNIIATGRLEKPFEEDFGADITSMFFELADENASENVSESIDNALYVYEPRAEILDIDVNLQPDKNSLSVTVTFKVVSTEEIITLNTFVSRLR
jgi:phage baseplate assembly protein W